MCVVTFFYSLLAQASIAALLALTPPCSLVYFFFLPQLLEKKYQQPGNPQRVCVPVRMSSTSLKSQHTSFNNSQKALIHAIHSRKDLKRTSLRAVVDLVGEDMFKIDVGPQVVESTASKLRLNFPTSNDTFDLAHHFNTVFKPTLAIRECLEVDDDQTDPIVGGELPAIMSCIINSLRKLKSMPQMRIVSAMKRFFRAVRTMSRLIRQRNMARKLMLLDVVKWWEKKEEDFRLKLQEDMTSPLFRFHHEIAEVIEMKQSLTIPQELKFGIVKMIYYRQRTSNSRARHSWVQSLKTITTALAEAKGNAQWGGNGKYMEPFESLIRNLRRSFWNMCDTSPVDVAFDKESITFERLMDVRTELQRMKSADNRKRLLSEFHDAVEATRQRRRVAYLAMEARREEDYKKRAAERQLKLKDFNEVQRIRDEVMKGRKQKRTSTVNIVCDASGSSPRSTSDGSPMSPGGPRVPSSIMSSATRSTSAGAGQIENSLSKGSTPRSAAGDVLSSSRRPSSRASTVSPTNSEIADDDVQLDHHSTQAPSSRRGTAVSWEAAVKEQKIPFAEPEFGSMENSWGEASLRGQQRAPVLRRTSSSVQLTNYALTRKSSCSSSTAMSRRSSTSLAPIPRVELEMQIASDPLAFLKRFGTTQFEDVLREKERQFRAELDASNLDEERKLVQQLLFKIKHTPTPVLEPFLETVSPAAVPSSAAMASSALSIRDDEGHQRDSDLGPLSARSDAPLTAPVSTEDPALLASLPRRADDAALRVHVPVATTVRVRAPLPNERRAVSALSHVTAPAALRSQSTPLEAAPTTSLMRPMSSELRAVISPWEKQRAAEGLAVNWAADVSAPAPRKSPPRSTQVPGIKLERKRLDPVLRKNRGASPALTHSQRSLSPATATTVSAPTSATNTSAEYTLVAAMVRAGELDLSGLRATPTEQLLHEQVMTVGRAKETLERQRHPTLNIKPQLYLSSTLHVHEDLPRRAPAAVTDPSPHPGRSAQRMSAPRQHASFLGAAKTSSVANDYKCRLQTILTALGDVA